MVKKLSQQLINTLFLIVLQVAYVNADQFSINENRQESSLRPSAVCGEEWPPKLF